MRFLDIFFFTFSLCFTFKWKSFLLHISHFEKMKVYTNRTWEEKQKLFWLFFFFSFLEQLSQKLIYRKIETVSLHLFSYQPLFRNFIFLNFQCLYVGSVYIYIYVSSRMYMYTQNKKQKKKTEKFIVYVNGLEGRCDGKDTRKKAM